MGKSGRFLQGVIFGGVLGSLAVLLIAPASGDETRATIIQRFNNIRSQFINEVENKKIELKEELERYKGV